MNEIRRRAELARLLGIRLEDQLGEEVPREVGRVGVLKDDRGVERDTQLLRHFRHHLDEPLGVRQVHERLGAGLPRA
eukprot:4912996-Prymnesium_polylepis.5